MGKFNLGELIAEGKVPELGTTAPGREQIEYIDIDRIDDDPKNFYELSDLDALAANIELLGLQQPLRVRTNPDASDRVIIVSGHRRRAAIRQLVEGGRGDLREIPCIREKNEADAVAAFIPDAASGGAQNLAYPEVMEALRELRLIYANSDTRRMTAADISKQAERVEMLLYQLKEAGMEFPGRMRDHVAEACKVSKSKLSRLKVIRESLIPPLKKVWESGKMGESVAYACAQHPAELQERLISFSKNCDYYTTPDRWYEDTVKSRTKTLLAEDALQCKKGAPEGKCINSAKRLETAAANRCCYGASCKSGKCCDGCPDLGKCKNACPQLADKIRKLKADASAARKQEALAKAERDRPEVEAITALWTRFGECRSMADKSMKEVYEAQGLKYGGKYDEIKATKLECLEEKITTATELPYGYSTSLSYIRYFRGTADLFGVSLDYLLCRTDDPKGIGAPAPAVAPVVIEPGTVAFVDGQAVPPESGLYYCKFDCEGHIVRQLARWDGEQWIFNGKSAVKIDAACLAWYPVPDDEN